MNNYKEYKIININSVTPFIISSAWSFEQHKYVSTQAFIIIYDTNDQGDKDGRNN